MAWASSYAITRHVVATVPPVLFAFLRFAIASGALLLLTALRKQPANETMQGKWGPIMILSLTGITLYQVFFNFSLQHTSASAGALIQGFIPISTAILAAIFLKEKLTPLQMGGIFISVTGVVLIGFTNQPQAAGGNTFLGNLLMIAAVLCWATYTVVAKKQAAVDPLWLITRLTIIGTILLVPITIMEMKDQSWPSISPSGWAAIAYMGIVTSALGYIWFNSALQHISASQAGVFINLDPVIGALIAVTFLGEHVHIWQIVGAALTMIGVWLYMFRNR